VETLKTFWQNLLVKSIAGFILLTLTCFESSFQDESSPSDPFVVAVTVQWKDMLQQFNFTSNIINIQKGTIGFTFNQILMDAASSNESGWHFFGGKEYGLFYTDSLRFFRMAVYLPPNILLQISCDMGACGCDDEDARFDDHLAGHPVPLLYIGAGGGLGSAGDFTCSLMASTDLTYYLVSFPGTDPVSGYGRADLWFDYAADELVWVVLHDHTKITLI